MIDALNRADAIELFHLSLVLDRLLQEPGRILKIRSRVHLGKTVRYLNPGQAGTKPEVGTGRVIEMRDTTLSLEDLTSHVRWKLPYAALQVDQDDLTSATDAVTHPPRAVPTREDFRVGDRVNFEDRYLQTRVGTIVRVNRHTASIQCDDDSGHWRVPFHMLRNLIDI